ncbi:hypothetical protein VNO77_37399 [Canavalia gladiata]|uniref:Uncharacterized protein n=1 Tax=Canavalia gladiata TaxID=3824 RepID=A0AAN9K869_CANGL
MCEPIGHRSTKWIVHFILIVAQQHSHPWVRVYESYQTLQPFENLQPHGGVGGHAYNSVYLSKVSSKNNNWRLVIDTTPKPCRAPIHTLNGPCSDNRK